MKDIWRSNKSREIETNKSENTIMKKIEESHIYIVWLSYVQLYDEDSTAI